MPSLPRFVKSPWTWAVAVLLVAAYAAAGFWWVPRLIADGVRSVAAQRYHRTAVLAGVRFNPFTLELELKGFALPDADGGPLLAFDRLYVNAGFSTLVRGGPVFKDIELEAPRVSVVRRPDGRVNLMDLTPPPAPAPQTTPGRALPRIYIGRLAVRDGAASIADRARREPLTLSLAPIGFTLHDFSTRSEGNAYAFDARSSRGETLTWRGTFGLQPIASQGTFKLSQIEARTLADIGRDVLRFDLSDDGRLDVDGRYDLSEAGESLSLKATIAEIVLSNLGLRAHGVAEDWVRLPHVAITDTVFDLGSRSVHVGHVTVDQPRVTAWRERSGAINVARLFEPDPSTQGLAAAPEPATAAEAPVAAAAAAATAGSTKSAKAAKSTLPAKSGKPAQAAAPAATVAATAPLAPTAPVWAVAVPAIEVNAADITVEDRGPARPVQLHLAPLGLKISGFASPLKEPFALTLDSAVNDDGHVTVKGNVGLNPLTGTFEVDARGLALAVLQPYLDPTTALTLKRGAAGARGQLVLAADGSIAFNGDAGIDGLSTVDNALGDDFIKWRSLSIREIRARSRPLALRVREIVAVDPYVRVIIGPDGTTNLHAILAPNAPLETGKAGATATGTAAAQEAPSPATKPAAARAGSRNAKNVPAAAPAPQAAGKALPVEIGRVRIVNGSANFADFSIKPSFETGIQQLAGTIEGLSGRADARADVHLEGKVDRYAPVTITGQVNYLAAVSYTNLKMRFENMELTNFSPYSGKFAGYRIEKGKLTMDLNYLVENRKLTASHHIVANQLQLGEHVESKDATGLPIKLAIALLKDRHGVIDLDLPVTGDLDDPQFRLGPIIWKLVVNLVTKIVTSPFALLGSLFGGGEELAFIDFPAGSGELDAAARGKVATLVKALDSRPALNLDIPQTVQPTADGAGLRAVRWNEQRRALAKRRLGKRAEQPGAIEQLLATPADYRALLEEVYKTAFGAKPQIPPSPAATPTASPGANSGAAPGAPGAAAADPAAKAMADAIAWLEAALQQSIVVSPSDLEELGKARAAAVQAALLDGTGIEPGRIFVVTAPPLPPHDGSVRMRLALR